ELGGRRGRRVLVVHPVEHADARLRQPRLDERPSDSARLVELDRESQVDQVVARLTSAVGRNVGARRFFVACSNAYASLKSGGSLHPRPIKPTPTGSPKTNPAGTVMWGYPATAAIVELPPVSWSPSTRSVRHAGAPVGQNSASSLKCVMTMSMPRVRELRRHDSRAFTYFGSVSGPFFWAISKISWPKYVSSRSLFVTLNAIASLSDVTAPPRAARYLLSPALNS